MGSTDSGLRSLRVSEYVSDLVDTETVIARELEKRNRRKKTTYISKEIRSNIIREILASDAKGLVYIDIDKLTSISDVFGEDIADYVAETVDALIKKNCLDGYIANKFFGDSFIITCDSNLATELAEDICNDIKNFDWSEKVFNLYVTCCAGIAIRKSSEKRYNSEQWIIRAILGCFNAKKSGGNRIQGEVISAGRYTSLNDIEYVFDS